MRSPDRLKSQSSSVLPRAFPYLMESSAPDQEARSPNDSSVTGGSTGIQSELSRVTVPAVSDPQELVPRTRCCVNGAFTPHKSTPSLEIGTEMRFG